MARGRRKNRRSAQNNNSYPRRNSIHGVLDKDDDLQMRDVFQSAHSNRRPKTTNGKGSTAQTQIVPFTSHFRPRDCNGPGRGNQKTNQNQPRNRRQRQREHNNNFRQNGNNFHTVTTNQNQLTSYPHPHPHNHHQPPASSYLSPQPEYTQHNLRTCTECSATRRANLTLRDWLSQSYLNTTNVLTSWSEEVGVGAESADEMDWQPEPVVRVLVLRDRDSDSTNSPSLSLAGMGFQDGRSTHQESSGNAPHDPPWNSHHYCDYRSGWTCKETGVSNVFGIGPRWEGWGLTAGGEARAEGLGVLDRKRRASGEWVRSSMSPTYSSPSIT
ncbi:hypothetical protein F5Y18DRAFT_430402 [Xylariaceae sp. FL1019]|nr:hypothetical protein F5Y18DRAFT_430402 [Xylariaceae sp. FL1019]